MQNYGSCRAVTSQESTGLSVTVEKFYVCSLQYDSLEHHVMSEQLKYS